MKKITVTCWKCGKERNSNIEKANMVWCKECGRHGLITLQNSILIFLQRELYFVAGSE